MSHRCCRFVGVASMVLVALVAAPPAAGEQHAGARGDATSLDADALRALAEQGDARAAFVLGAQYASGAGVGRDDSAAVRWFGVAAEAGLAEAQHNLALMHANGRGVERDLAAAVRWYRRAAEQGLAEAQYNLGVLYEGGGDGITRDAEAAAQWFQRAAYNGLPEAQHNLGVLYEEGRGVAQSDSRALQWYSRAAAQGFAPSASRRDAALARLTPKPATEAPKPAAGGEGGAAGWLVALDPAHYTIQLASFLDRAKAARLLASLTGPTPGAVYESVKSDRRWWSVVYGAYPSAAAARAAAERLPDRLRALRPWPRPAGAIQGEIASAR